MTVFVDTLYWLAVANPRDTWHEPAKAARARLGAVRLVTTDEVLTEFLTAVAGGGAFLRQRAASVVRTILADETVTVLPQSRATFLAGLSLYESRTDKGYSLTDCISMSAMRAESLTEVLTNDHHFEQEGCHVLIRRTAG